MANQYLYTPVKVPQCNALLSLCFELPVFNALDEAIIQGLLDNVLRVEFKNVTFEVPSFVEIYVKLG